MSANCVIAQPPKQIKWSSPKRYIGGSRGGRPPFLSYAIDCWKRILTEYFKFRPCHFSLYQKKNPSPPYGNVCIRLGDTCTLSPIVEDSTTISVVDCVKFSVLVNHCVRPSCSLVGSTYPQKKQQKTKRLTI